MTTNALLSRTEVDVKQTLLNAALQFLDSVLDAARSGASARELELKVQSGVKPLGASLLGAALDVRSLVAAEKALEAEGLTPSEVRWRRDKDYTASLMTTLGPVQFSWHAYRVKEGDAWATRNPAQDAVLPLWRKCRSSPLCVEWSCRLASLEPFRKAQELLTYFTHGAVSLEDTTIARHAIRAGHDIEQSWLYLAPEVLRETLRERATRDRETGRPIVYVSCDAHALRRYVDESWGARWKMVNGIRVWCVDDATGSVIHVGGEFTCGRAEAIAKRLRQLIKSGYLPKDGDMGDDLRVQYVFVADGMPWIEEQLASQLPGAVRVLDAYHVLERLAEFARTCCRRTLMGKPNFLRAAKQMLLGERPPKARRLTSRAGRRKDRVHRSAVDTPRPKQRNNLGERLARLIETSADTCFEFAKKTAAYFRNNDHRIDYATYRWRGFQIGSGAMESQHRTGSQTRTKRAGARWLPGTLDAIFNLRMLDMVGRWDEYFAQEPLNNSSENAFQVPEYRLGTGERKSS